MIQTSLKLRPRFDLCHWLRHPENSKGTFRQLDHKIHRMISVDDAGVPVPQGSNLTN